MHRWLPVLLLCACAATPDSARHVAPSPARRGSVAQPSVGDPVVIAFDRDAIEQAHAMLHAEQRSALREVRLHACCFLLVGIPGETPTFDLDRVRGNLLGVSDAPIAHPDAEWCLDVLGVRFTCLEDRPAIRVESCHGDRGGLARVVAWLEARGGNRVAEVR